MVIQPYIYYNSYSNIIIEKVELWRAKGAGALSGWLFCVTSLWVPAACRRVAFILHLDLLRICSGSAFLRLDSDAVNFICFSV